MGSQDSVGQTLKRAIRHGLCFIRLIDPHDGLISLTNVIMIVIITKIAFSKDTSLVNLGMLLCAVGNYTAKKVINQGLGQPGPVAPGPGEGPTPLANVIRMSA